MERQELIKAKAKDIYNTIEMLINTEIKSHDEIDGVESCSYRIAVFFVNTMINSYTDNDDLNYWLDVKYYLGLEER